jgi:hypothetical protein
MSSSDRRSSSETRLIMTSNVAPHDGGYAYKGSNPDDSTCGRLVGGAIWVFSMILIICTLPFSLCVSIKMVQVCLWRGDIKKY